MLTVNDLTNVSEGISSVQEGFSVSVWIRTPIIFSVSFFVITSNILNISILRRTRTIPHISKLCLTNLSIADLSVGLVTCAPCVVSAVLGYWPYGDVWCQIAGVTHGTSVTVSIWSLSIVSIDRYIALMKPLHYPSLVTTRRCYVGLVSCWVLAIATFSSVILTKPDFIYYRFNFNEGMCGLYWEYPLFCIITGMAIPCLSGSIILFTTVSIVVRIKTSEFVTAGSSISRQRTRRDVKAVKILSITAGMFFMCWGPYSASVIMSAFDPSIHIPKELQFTFLWLANSNSFMNVIIYSAVYEAFRHEVKVILVPAACLRQIERDVPRSTTSISLNSQATIQRTNSSDEL
ncbi:alpha-1A adrenergic receptor-like [Haliotis rufescens]|uniref:alpha-1A adrenergic receptor-like n=1 Tax=Haliotis rufescens TaxID=6454 RepID=UPI001EAFA3FB|nr:alpha-1A adrenergic receptor-like [Haliotis rufescens]